VGSPSKGAVRRPARPRHVEFRGLGVSGLHALHAADWGPKRARRVVVCVHGYSGNGRDFDALAQALAADGVRVVCPDVVGRGRSAWLSPLQYHFPRFIADVRTLLAHLEIDAVDWVGTSMGGLMGMMLAAQASTPIRRLVVNDVGAYVPLDALQHIARNLDAPPSFPSRRAVEAHLRHTHRDWGEITDAQWKQLAYHHSFHDGDAFRLHYDPQIAIVARPPPMAPGLAFWDSWYRVRSPVLLLRGEHSAVFPPDVAQAMLDSKPQARLAEIAGAGHAPSLMAPDQIGLLREFLVPEPVNVAAVSPESPHEPTRRLHPSRPA
jgi:pimeloyl-ACP methyl ester carboxylesterase